ncbi:hypothetical protein [Polaromonas sp. YR568]|uniref:hypothetical protein n=1 Tax=Polaromonas sp. YR568 TaxID=1855301 RepID=UPI0031382604
MNHTDPTRAALGVRWLVLMVILFGALVSSVGNTNSHGIAALSAAHEHSHSHEDAHGSADEASDAGWTIAGPAAPLDHPHHGADHSHDKAHASPLAWPSATPQLPVWFGVVRPWIDMVQASRLERPPMG